MTKFDEKEIAEHLGKEHLGQMGAQHSEQLAEILSWSPEKRAEAERKLLRKMDIRLIPWMTLLYLMSFLDRVNVGAANLWDLTKDLHMTSHQFSIATLVFFVSYVAFEVPSNMVLKRFRPSRFIPATMVLWAIVQTLMGLVNTYHQLIALRFVLGIFESGLFPGLNFYLNGWYKRDELNKRTAVFFGGAVLAGAFGGILGFGLGHMHGIGGRPGWAWIFIMEGLLTFVIACASFGMIHDWPDRARFLTPIERELALLRLRDDTGLAQGGVMDRKAVMRGFTDWKTYLFMLCYVGAAHPLYSLANFSPTVISFLGKWSPAQSLLLSVPPYVLAFCTTLGTAYLSDKFLKRGIFNIFWATIAIVGYIILLTVSPVKHGGVSYFALFLATMSVAPMIATTISWGGNNFGGHYKKAVAMGMYFSSGNAGGIWSALCYRTSDKPNFRPGHGSALAFAALNLITSIILIFGMRAQNKKREETYGPAPGPDEIHNPDDPEYRARWGLEGMSHNDILNLGDDHPAFRYVL